MTKTFQCGCVIADDEEIQFCKDHWVDYFLTGNVVYPKEDDGSIFLIKNEEFLNSVGQSIFSDIKKLKLKFN